jgi:HEAT repeat protein
MERLVELSHDPSTDVVAAAIHALGSHGDPSALDAVLAWTDSPEWSIRASVARAFPGITGRLQPYALPPDHARRVIEALMALAEDESGDVRERALFAIGGRYEVDTPELRDLLARHLDDPHDGAAEQAIFALARRRDEQAFPALVRVLTPERATRLFIESAAHLADERLLPALQGLTATWPGYETPLLDALRACDPAERARWEIYGAALAGELEARLRDLMADRLFVVEVGREPFEYVPQLTAGWSSIGGAGVTLSYDLTALVDTRLGGNLASAGEIFTRDIIEADLAAD